MNGKLELVLIGARILAALLSLGAMSDPVPTIGPVQHDPYTANGFAWNN